MLVVPAIDLKDGKAVRLRQGRPDHQTLYGNPLDVARRFEAQGARLIHLVDLDAALGSGENTGIAAQLFEALSIPVQFGGGLRSMSRRDKIFSLGAARAVLGTAAVECPDFLAEALARYGDKIVVSVDARGGKVALRGWRESSHLTVEELSERLKAAGVARLIYTDIERDGMMLGPDIEGALALARLGLKVLVSGGISNLEQLQELRRYGQEGIEGAIVGKALYEGKIDLARALRT